MLKKILKILVTILGTIMILFIMLFLLLLVLAKITTPFKGVNAMEKDFSKNEDHIDIVKNYFVELKYDTSSINLPNEALGGTTFISTENRNFYIDIEDASVISAVQQLADNGYKHIEKRADCINFLRWSTKDAGTGIVYSIDGHTPTESSLSFLTKLEPLNEDGWYYYEENYNEWRIRNKGKINKN